MTADYLQRALIDDAKLGVTLVETTEACRKAKGLHDLATTSTIALGRLLSATALTGLYQRNLGTTSLQIVCQGRLANLYAEVTQDGQLRGFVKNHDLALPQMKAGGELRRRIIGPGIGAGTLAVNREPPKGHFTQSTTDLSSGEIDRDVEHFLNTSEQIHSALACDVLVDNEGRVVRAAGLLVQVLPDGDAGRLGEIEAALRKGLLPKAMETGAGTLLQQVLPDARAVEDPEPLRWQCRCSHDRVIGALRMMGPAELRDMITKSEAAEVRCEFCGQLYVVDLDAMGEILQQMQDSREVQ